ncbi:MAG: glycine betaine ABC transporter substrate-binding protein [Chlamydiota bacterium]
MKSFYGRLALYGMFFLLVVLLFHLPSFSNKDRIMIGAKNNPECQILAEIMTQMVERDTSYPVRNMLCLEGTYVAFHALVSKSIDLYVDYTGTLLLTILGEIPSKRTFSELQEQLAIEKQLSEQFGISIVFPFGFRNAYVLLAREDFPQNRIRDLTGMPLRYGFDAEFIARKESQLLKDRYQLSFQDCRLMDTALLYLSLQSSALDVISANHTDGDILRYPVKILEGDPDLFPAYSAVCLARKGWEMEHPEIVATIGKLQNKISVEKMREMNAAFAQGVPRREIAKKFLKESNL